MLSAADLHIRTRGYAIRPSALRFALLTGTALAVATLISGPAFAQQQPGADFTYGGGSINSAQPGDDGYYRNPSLSYDEMEEQRLRDFERRRNGYMSQAATGMQQGGSMGTVDVPSTQEIRAGLDYSEEENERLESNRERQQGTVSSAGSSQAGAIPAGSGGSELDEIVARNIDNMGQEAVDQASTYTGTVRDFQERTGAVTQQNCSTMTSASSSCGTSFEATEAAFQQGLNTDIRDPSTGTVQGQQGGASTNVPPIRTSMSDLEEPEVELDESMEGRINPDAIQPVRVEGSGTFGPDGDPLNLDEMIWDQLLLSDEDRTLDWEEYTHYKVYGFNMTGTEWYGNDRFLVPNDFFFRADENLGGRQYLRNRDRQIARNDRLITFREYHSLIADGYNMTGVRYFGDDLGIQVRSYSYWNDDDDREPWYWDTEAYELPLDFIERQNRDRPWQEDRDR